MIWNLQKEEAQQILKGHDHVVETIYFLTNDQAKVILSSAEYCKSMSNNNHVNSNNKNEENKEVEKI